MSIFSNRFSAAKEEAGDYTRAMLGLLGDQDPLVVLGKAPNELTKLVEGLSPEEIARPEAHGKWSILQVVRHLGDSELIWAYRMRRILSEDRPTIDGYDQDNWADRLHYDRADFAEALAEIRAVRAGNLRLIRSLDAAQLQRVGVHTERGEESIAHLIRMYAGHDILHQRQLARIRDAVRSRVGA
jgi:uncharacterized damage-inducible protein DinB